MAGTSRRSRAFGNRPGRENDEGGLEEFRGLDAEDPAPRALDFVAEQQGGEDQRHRDEIDERAPCGAPGAATGRRADQQDDRGIRNSTCRLTKWKVGRCSRRPPADCRPCQHQPQTIRAPTRREQPAVHGPPPVREGAERSARETLRPLELFADASRSATSSRTASPRFSKLANCRKRRRPATAARPVRLAAFAWRRAAAAMRRVERPAKFVGDGAFQRRGEILERPRRSDRPCATRPNSGRSGSMPPSLALPPRIQKIR